VAHAGDCFLLPQVQADEGMRAGEAVAAVGECVADPAVDDAA